MVGPVGQLRRVLFALTGALGLAMPAAADNAGRPMTFTWGEVYDGQKAIFADGDFVVDTPFTLRRFLVAGEYTADTKIYFNSRGGDLASGMEVGKIIRDLHLNTGVAVNARDPAQAGLPDMNAYSKVYPGYCISACTLAFLGGVSRQVDQGSTYAVHQVAMECVDKTEARSHFPWVLMAGVNYCPDIKDAVSMVQIANSAVLQYVKEMGADPLFITEMSKADSRNINSLTEEQLAAYKVNFTLKDDTWAFDTDANGALFLGFRSANEWKEDQAQFYCDRSGSPRLFLWVMHDTRRSSGRKLDPAPIIALAQKGLSIHWELPQRRPDGFADTRSLMLEPYEIILAPEKTQHDNIRLRVDLSQRFLDVLNTSKNFEVVTSEPDVNGITGFSFIRMDNVDHEKVAGIMRSCR
jgi:hypothetical protein